MYFFFFFFLGWDAAFKYDKLLDRGDIIKGVTCEIVSPLDAGDVPCMDGKTTRQRELGNGRLSDFSFTTSRDGVYNTANIF